MKNGRALAAPARIHCSAMFASGLRAEPHGSDQHATTGPPIDRTRTVAAPSARRYAQARTGSVAAGDVVATTRRHSPGRIAARRSPPRCVPTRCGAAIVCARARLRLLHEPGIGRRRETGRRGHRHGGGRRSRQEGRKRSRHNVSEHVFSFRVSTREEPARRVTAPHPNGPDVWPHQSAAREEPRQFAMVPAGI